MCERELQAADEEDKEEWMALLRVAIERAAAPSANDTDTGRMWFYFVLYCISKVKILILIGFVCCLFVE